MFWPETGWINPVGVQAHPSAQRHCRKNKKYGGKRAQEPASQVVELADRRRVEECRAVIVNVLIGCLPGHGSRNDHSKQADVGDHNGNGKRRVEQDLATGSEVHSGSGESSSGEQRKK